MAEEDADARVLRELLVAVELGAVVDGDRVTAAESFDSYFELRAHLRYALRLNATERHDARFAVVDDDDVSALPISDDEVGLVVSQPRAPRDDRWPLLDADPSWASVRSVLPRAKPLFSPPKTLQKPVQSPATFLVARDELVDVLVTDALWPVDLRAPSNLLWAPVELKFLDDPRPRLGRLPTALLLCLTRALYGVLLRVGPLPHAPRFEVVGREVVV